MSPENKIKFQNILLFIVIGLGFGLTYNFLYYPHTWTEFLEAGSISILIGIMLGTLEEFILKNLFARISFYKVLLIRTFLYSIFISIILALVLSIEIAFIEEISFGKALIEYFQSPMFTRDLSFSMTFVFLMIFIIQIIQLLGKANFFRLLVGRYHQPREVERIFMFLDLKDSTTMAEKLDNRTYSNLIKDFFYDISDAVAMFNGEIFQYVGDEMVVVWRVRESNLDCILCYYKMIEIIKKRDQYYETHYGTLPEFKAGIHAGKVIMTEVGKFKKEIAYHGDTINIASRIEGKCNELNQNLLVSKDVLSYLSGHEEFHVHEIGEISLKGKSEKLSLYGL